MSRVSTVRFYAPPESRSRSLATACPIAELRLTSEGSRRDDYTHTHQPDSLDDAAEHALTRVGGRGTASRKLDRTFRYTDIFAAAR